MRLKNDLRSPAEVARKRRILVRQDGIIIVAVLWICALVMWFSLQISTENRLQGEEQIHGLRKSQALHLAIGGCYEALARMGQPLPLSREELGATNWQPDGQPRIVDYETGQALVVVESESQKLNVNLAAPEQLKPVLEKAGVDEGDSERIADAIADFIDSDDVPRLHGTEKDGYQKAGLHHIPFNGPIARLEQLLLVPGITSQLLYGYGMTRVTQEATEAEEVHIPSLPGRDSLFEMLSVYGTNTSLNQTQAEERLKEKVVTWQSGGIYRILSCGKSSGGAPAVVMCLIVRYSPGTQNGYEVLYRKIL